MPHTPWPLVHPFPILVPAPTNKPPRINKGKELVKILSISFPENEYKTGPIIKPTKNNKLSNLFSFFNILLEAIKLTPDILPLKTKNKNAAKPINNPPVNADRGVKFIITINLLIQEKLD